MTFVIMMISTITVHLHDIHLLINCITTIFWRGKPDSLYQKPRPYKITIWRGQFHKPHIVGKILYYLQTLFLFNIWKINLNTWIKSLKLIGKPNKNPIKETSTKHQQTTVSNTWPIFPILSIIWIFLQSPKQSLLPIF